ncbi:MAG TPA: DUF1963 domain-containing protein [Drouetiella sp.]|jgi:Domain of unknown function (DUF1963)
MSIQNFSTPVDKHARPMRRLVSLDLSQAAQRLDTAQAAQTLESIDRTRLPSQGLLVVFIADEIEKYQPKDKNGFKVIWHSSSDLAADLAGDLAPDMPPPLSQAGLGRSSHPRLEEAKAICAFSANGISYSAARSKDDCYSHLMAQVPRWNLILQCSDAGTDYLLLIHEDDIASEQLDKAWLVRFKGNT